MKEPLLAVLDRKVEYFSLGKLGDYVPHVLLNCDIEESVRKEFVRVANEAE